MNDLSLFKQFAPQAPKKFHEGNNAVIYTRVSSADQEDNTSLASQKRYCEMYASKRDLNVVGYFGGTYESAKTDDRKEFNRMLTFVKKSKNISYVIVYSYERFSRSGINGASIADELLKKYGVITLATTQELDPTTPSGSFQQKILFLFGQMDNELRRDKVVTGMREMLMKGYWVWKPPRGYDVLNKGSKATERQIIINKEGKILKKAFEWKAYSELPNIEIVRKLQKLGVNITDKKLHELFVNPFYCGLIVSKLISDKVVEGKHTPLISKKLFLAANNIRNEKRVHGFVHDMDSENLPLKVFTKCEKCGSSITGYKVKKNDLYYYKCRSKGCNVNRSAKTMHDLFRDILNMFQIDPETTSIIKVQLEEQMTGFFKNQLDDSRALKLRLTETRRRVEAIEERFVIGEIDRTLYDKFRNRYEKECFAIERELNKVGGYSSNLKRVVNYAVDLCRNPMKLWDSSDLNGKKIFQNLLFPEGIYYNLELDRVRTVRINIFFTFIPEIARDLRGYKKGDYNKFDEIPRWVEPTGKMSNFLVEDYDAVLKFMSAETQKRRHKL